MKKILGLFLFVIFYQVGAQTYPMSSANNGQTIVTCTGTFTDDGGAGANYSNNITDRTLTFCTANPGELLRFNFTSFNTEANYDILEIFNGPTATGMPAQTLSGNLGAFVFISNQPGGCVTFRFNSDFGVNRPGWVADISCVEPCVAPTAVLADTATEEICASSAVAPGDLTVNFDASGSYSNDSYTISSYEWNWGDGTTSVTTTPVTTHTFPDDPGIYTVTLKVRTNNTGTDPLGCLSSNTAVKLVMVLPPPNFEGSTEGPITISCGDTVELTGIAGSQIITQEPPPNVGSEISLPDGDGVSYYSYLDLTGYFPPGATLSASCFPEIMIELEHSFAGDLWIDLIAPTGEEVRLFNGYGPFGGQKFGWCVNGADNLQPGCVAPYHIVSSGGINWGAAEGYTNTTQTCDVYPGPCESGQYFLQGATFNSSGSFNSLVGAELNGVWVLKISDEWAIDDGFISSWSISFPGDCYSDLETETPILDGGLWTHTGAGPAVPTSQTVANEPILPTGMDPCPGEADCTGNQLSNTITVGPFNQAGTYVYSFNVTDEYGCEFVHEVEIIVEGVETEFEEIQTEYCQNATPEPLPSVSANGVQGTWSPAVIDTSVVGGPTIYTFTPDSDECGSIYEIEVTITELLQTDFTINQEYCQDDEADTLPLISNQGYAGTWFPAEINTSEFGVFTYTFTPDDVCVETFEIEITINERLIPAFTEIEPICQNTTPPALNLTSNNGIPGTWLPAVIDTNVDPGEYEYVFTPDEGECATPLTIIITISEEQAVDINLPNTYCEGSAPDNLPTVLDNGVIGHWIPAIIDTNTLGTSTYTFYPDDGQCALETPFVIEIYPNPELNPVAIQEICDDDFDGVYETDLTDLNVALGGGTGITYIYYGSLADFNNDNPIPAGQLNNYQFTSLPATIYVVGQSGEGCRSAEIPVQFLAQDIVPHNSGPFGPIEYCPEDTVDLTQFTGNIGGGGADYNYYNTLNDARNQTNQINNPATFTPGTTQTSVFVRLNMTGYCPAFVEILIERLPTPTLQISESSMILCEGDSFEASATSDDPNATFEWTFEDGTVMTGAVQTIDQIGTYTVVAFSADGCISEERTLTVSLPSTPVITGIEMGNNFVIVSAANNSEGPLEYSLDGVLWQSTPQFNNLIPGETYTIWVRSRGCMIEKYDLTLLSVPNLISPNNDGKNDTWTIRGIEATPGATIKIFDRYGKIFVDTNFEGNYEWNGKYLGNNVPSGDYWYILHIPSDGILAERKFVGHISVRNQ